MKVESFLRDIENKDLVLPEFQRDYIWQEEDVKKFMQSLYRNYPTGSLLNSNSLPKRKNFGRSRITMIFLEIGDKKLHMQ